MRNYEASRKAAEELIARRKSALYAQLPRIAEIDDELKNVGVSLVRNAMAGDAKGLVAIRAKTADLEKEKHELMAEKGIPADYLEAVYNCMVCKDTGYKAINEANKAEALPQPCPCLKQRLIERHYALSNIMGILERENFEHFDIRSFSPHIDEANGLSPQANMQYIYNLTLDFVENFDNKFDNLLLHGRAGLGKTFVCHCIAKDLLDSGHTVLYLTAPRLFKMIEDYRFNRAALDAPEEMMDAVTDVDLLVLDDLGAEMVTVVTSSALFDIINQRLLSQKHTVISTNLSHVQLGEVYSDRITSRIMGNYSMLKFFGEDLRTKKKYGGGYGSAAN